MRGWRPDQGQAGTPPRGTMPSEAAPELLHERTLAERIALVRLVLTLASFAIIGLDHSIPSSGTNWAYTWAYGAAGLFLLYAAAAWAVLTRKRISLSRHLRLSAVLDVLFASLLIIATDGYLSPFNLWLVFAVVGSSFSRYRKLPLLTAGLGLLAHSLIATIPQERPLDIAVFAVRTSYLFGFAAVLAWISSYLVGQSRALAAFEETGRRLGETLTGEAAGRILLGRLKDALNIGGAKLSLTDGTCLEDGGAVEGRPATADWSLRVGAEVLGALAVYRKTPLTGPEEAIARVLCDRAASTLLRIRLSDRLVSAARAEERVRLADQLHDTYLQTLAALDLRAEAARKLVDGPRAEVVSELLAIKQISQQAGAQIRQALAMQPLTATGPGPTALRKLVAQRWTGPAEVDIAPDVTLSDEQWRAVESLVKEGLNNAKKHAAAKRVSLRLHRSADSQIVCSLENDGAPLPAQPQPGYGLTRLRAVIEEQGGQLSLVPGQMGGALLLATFGVVPWNQSAS